MIGHFLLALAPEQEDRVLLKPMGDVRHPTFGPRSPGCLIQVAMDSMVLGFGPTKQVDEGQLIEAVGRRYDDLSVRFGEHRVNAAIRNRILANRARRVLASVSLETVGQPQS